MYIVLVLSAIGSGSNFLSNLFSGLFYGPLHAIYDSGEWRSMLPLLSKMSGQTDSSIFEAAMEQSMSVPRVVYLLWTLLYGMSLAGIILMFRRHKNGLHFYAIAQLLVLVVTLLFLGKAHLIVGEIMMTLLFIFYYWTTFRQLERLRPADEEPSGEEESEE